MRRKSGAQPDRGSATPQHTEGGSALGAPVREGFVGKTGRLDGGFAESPGAAQERTGRESPDEVAPIAPRTVLAERFRLLMKARAPAS